MRIATVIPPKDRSLLAWKQSKLPRNGRNKLVSLSCEGFFSDFFKNSLRLYSSSPQQYEDKIRSVMAEPRLVSR